MGTRKKRRKQLRKKRVKLFLYSFLLILFLALLGACIYGYSILCRIKHTEIKIEPREFRSLPRNEYKTAAGDNAPPPEEVMNIALFGLDREKNEVGRSDTIIVASLDKYSKKIRLASLMRDMYVNIPGRGHNRINAAYVFGGPGLAIDTINKNFNLDIKYYVTVDFKGVEMLIDELGGTEVYLKEGELPHIFWDYNLESPGLYHLNGRETLAYMRIRRFGNGDYERTERQRRILSILLDKIKEQSVLKFPDLVSSVLPYIETNMSRQEIMEYGILTLSFGGNLEQTRLPYDGMFKNRYIRGMAVLVPDMEANAKHLHEFLYGNEYPVAAITP